MAGTVSHAAVKLTTSIPTRRRSRASLRARLTLSLTLVRVHDLPFRIDRRDLPAADDVPAIHQPHRDGAVSVTPEDVCAPIPVVIPAAHDAPRGIDRGDDLAAADRHRPIHQPDRHLAGRRLSPEDVRTAVAVVVTGADDLPRWIDGTDVTGADRVHAVHQPDDHRAITVSPQQIGAAVAVVVA